MKSWWKRVQRYDWRVIGLVGALAVAGVATVVMPLLGYSVEPSTKFGAFYASWLAGVLLFATVGIIVAVASMVRPHEDWFEARARNLFRRASGEKIDYIIDRLRTLEHYSEKTAVKITVRDFVECDGEKKYLVEDFDSMEIKSFIDDIDTSFESRYELSDITPPPSKHGSKNCLVYVKVNRAFDVERVIFEGAVEHSYTVPVKRNSFGVVDTLACLWVRADDEVNSHEPKRFTERLTVDVENRLLTHQPVKVRLFVEGKEPQEFEIESAGLKRVYEAQDLRPGAIAYDLRILAP